MYKFWESIKKEYYLLVNDKTGLTLMFIMPLLLVLIVTVIQDSAFRMVNDNMISMLVANHDKGDKGEELEKMLGSSGMFGITNGTWAPEELNELVRNGEALTGLYIPESFSDELATNTEQLSNLILANMGLGESDGNSLSGPGSVIFFNDAALQENYVLSITNVIRTHLSVIEVRQMLGTMYNHLGVEEIPEEVETAMLSGGIQIQRYSSAETLPTPNSTQHNVPAWTVFAMFFMVISLGTNLVLEKAGGSFLRLKAMPSSIAIVMLSKQVVYVLVGVLQVSFIFGIAWLVFPWLGLPRLTLAESNVTGLLLVVLMSSFSAVSYSLMLGAIARTQEQSNGFGAISVIIFAAIGGIWVPSFVMPEFLRLLSQLSPLHWCLESFYVLFLRGGDWAELAKPLYILLIFSLICQFISYVKLRRDQLI